MNDDHLVQGSNQGANVILNMKRSRCSVHSSSNAKCGWGRWQILRDFFSAAILGFVFFAISASAQSAQVDEKPAVQLEAESLPNAPDPVVLAAESADQKSTKNND